MISDAVENVDTYVNNGSTWLIFTEEKRWVIELTKDGTLWYNYGFVRNIFSYLSTDVVENQQYITKWVEDNIINKKKPVKNGVKDTSDSCSRHQRLVEDAIQNGVKKTGNIINGWTKSAEDTIQNGVKDTSFVNPYFNQNVEETIENGVKETHPQKFNLDGLADDIIDNGVKEVRTDDGYVNHFRQNYKFNNIIENNLKDC